MKIQPKDSFWSVITIPFRLVGVIIFALLLAPLIFVRKIWAPHISGELDHPKEIYMFIRYGNYKDDGMYD